MAISTPFSRSMPLQVPAPLLFLPGFLAGVGLQSLMPLTLPSPPVLELIHDLGLVLLIMGLLLVLPCMGQFLRARTPLFPHGAASTLIVSGAYRWSRNPMYLSLLLTYMGVCAVYLQAGALILLPLPVILLDRVVIPFEEHRLATKFGEQYRTYCLQVRRWL